MVYMGVRDDDLLHLQMWLADDCLKLFNVVPGSMTIASPRALVP